MRDLIRMTGEELRELPRDKTLFFYAVGAPQERGPHLPLGLDLFLAEGMVDRIASSLAKEQTQWEFVRMPSAPLGIDTATTSASFPIRAHVLRDWLIDSSSTLIRMGFIHFVCISGGLGARDLTAIEEVGPMLRKRFPFKRRAKAPKFIPLSSSWVVKKDQFRSLFFPNPAEHGGEIETSIALALDPGFVNRRNETLTERKISHPYFLRFLDWLNHKTKSYWGNPAAASSLKGLAVLEERVRDGAVAISRILSGASDRIRSGYASYPHLRSFFKAWFWAVGVGVLLAFWLYLTILYLPR